MVHPVGPWWRDCDSRNSQEWICVASVCIIAIMSVSLLVGLIGVAVSITGFIRPKRHAAPHAPLSVRQAEVWNGLRVWAEQTARMSGESSDSVVTGDWLHGHGRLRVRLPVKLRPPPPKVRRRTSAAVQSSNGSARDQSKSGRNAALFSLARPSEGSGGGGSLWGRPPRPGADGFETGTDSHRVDRVIETAWVELGPLGGNGRETLQYSKTTERLLAASFNLQLAVVFGSLATITAALLVFSGPLCSFESPTWSTHLESV